LLCAALKGNCQILTRVEKQMDTLWKKQGCETDEDILAFTTGDDPVLDINLVPFDVIGSIAHARGLNRIGLLDDDETSAICGVLCEICHEHDAGARQENDVRARHPPSPFGLLRTGASPLQQDEDVHSMLERVLTEKLGDTGKKIHAGRSRNDQVLTALRLFMKKTLLDSMHSLAHLCSLLCSCGENYRGIIMPGYTHGQRAMPSTLAFWYAQYAEGLTDTLESGRALYSRLDSSPLGAAAGFGAPLPLDRAYTAQLMGFGRVQANAGAVQNSRGRLEAALLSWFAEAGSDIGKMCRDLLQFTTSEFGFVKIPESFCTGSSIMPQKKNPDVLELLRATPAVIRAARNEIEDIISGLGSSYHRDFQLTKPPLFRGIENGRKMISIMSKIIPGLEFNAEKMKQACSIDLFATHRAVELVNGGMSFRDAYAQTAQELKQGNTEQWKTDPDQLFSAPSHTGSVINPGIDDIRSRINAVCEWLESKTSALEKCWIRILKQKT